MTPTTAAILEMFPKCAGCGRLIRDGEPVTAIDGRQRVRCADCAPTTEANTA